MKESSTNKEQICRNCPIFNPVREVCNPNLWINPDTNEISVKSKPGYIRGCGCFLKYKWKNSSSHCNAGKW